MTKFLFKYNLLNIHLPTSCSIHEEQRFAVLSLIVDKKSNESGESQKLM